MRVNELEIMSREDEFSINPRSLYLVIVASDADVYSASNPDGDYRMVLHRILFHTGRPPVLAVCGDARGGGSSLLSPPMDRFLRQIPLIR